MKKTIILTFAFSLLTIIAFTGTKFHTDVFKLDSKQSSLEWYAEKVTGKHNGTIMFSSGELKNDHGKLTGSFEIDMSTIENKDMTGEYKAKLERHLKSDDFFSVEKFPKSKFVITSVTPLTAVKDLGYTHNVKGLLTIKDKTNEVSFDSKISIEENKISCNGSIIIDRSKYDVKYGSKTFFADIGDKMIYDNFTMKFNFIAVK